MPSELVKVSIELFTGKVAFNLESAFLIPLSISFEKTLKNY